jgi:hypothetical protein
VSGWSKRSTTAENHYLEYEKYKMNKLESVLQKLKQQNFNPGIRSEIVNGNNYNEIIWTASSNEKCFISEDHIAIEENKIAWFQSSNQDRHLLTIYDGDTFFTWTPKTYNPIFGCYCILIEWFKDHLIFIYQEKHEIYICSVKDGKVNYFNFKGEEIERKGEVISYETYSSKSEKVKLIKIPV